MGRRSKPNGEKLKHVGVLVHPQTAEQAEKLAERKEWSVSHVYRKAIEAGLKHVERAA